MDEAFNDLQRLALFPYSVVPPPSSIRNSIAISLFAPLLVSLRSSTVAWRALSSALITYFGSPASVARDSICSGWDGLEMVVCCFRRLELAIDQGDLAEMESWINSLLRATIDQSLAYRSPRDRHLLGQLLSELSSSVARNHLATCHFKPSISVAVPSANAIPSPTSSAMSHPRAVKRSIESYTETEKLERDTELAKKEEEARITLELLLTRNKRARSSSGSDEGDIALLTSPSTSGSTASSRSRRTSPPSPSSPPTSSSSSSSDSSSSSRYSPTATSARARARSSKSPSKSASAAATSSSPIPLAANPSSPSGTSLNALPHSYYWSAKLSQLQPLHVPSYDATQDELLHFPANSFFGPLKPDDPLSNDFLRQQVCVEGCEYVMSRGKKPIRMREHFVGCRMRKLVFGEAGKEDVLAKLCALQIVTQRLKSAQLESTL